MTAPIPTTFTTTSGGLYSWSEVCYVCADVSALLSVIHNAVALVKKIPLDSLQQHHAVAMRRYTVRYLLNVIKPPARERTCCDAMDCKEPSEQSVPLDQL